MDNQTIERVRKGLKDPGIGPETIALMVKILGITFFMEFVMRLKEPLMLVSRE